MSKVEAFRQHHFEDVEQQHQASWLGMWVFLATEVMFFGGMFACYFVYRHWYLQAFSAASNQLNLWLGDRPAEAIDYLPVFDHRFGADIPGDQVF